MTKEEKKAIDEIRNWRNYIIKNKEKVNRANDIEFYLRTVLNLIQNLQEEIKLSNKVIDKRNVEKLELADMCLKKDKIIDLMADKLVQDTEWFYSEFDNYTKEDFRQYFEKKAEEDK